MTFRLCFVGNSHLGALKRAWKRIGSEFPDIEVSMFGAAGSSFRDVVVEGDMIVATSRAAARSFRATGGKKRIRLSDCDGLVVVGSSASLLKLGRLLQDYMPPFMNPELVDSAQKAGRPDFVERLRALNRRGEPRLVSTPLFLDMLRAVHAKSHGAELLAAVSRVRPMRLAQVTTPYPSSSLAEARPQDLISQLVKLGYGPLFADMVAQTLADILPKGAKLIRPPADLLVEGILTERSYSDGSMALREEKGEHDEDDLFHMNEAYGEVMLRRIILEMSR
jgi:hypothetical protein